ELIRSKTIRTYWYKNDGVLFNYDRDCNFNRVGSSIYDFSRKRGKYSNGGNRNSRSGCSRTRRSCSNNPQYHTRKSIYSIGRRKCFANYFLCTIHWIRDYACWGKSKASSYVFRSVFRDYV